MTSANAPLLCLSCGAPNRPYSVRCDACGRSLVENDRARERRLRTLLNEVESLSAEGLVDAATRDRLRDHYREQLEERRHPATVPASPLPTTPIVPPPMTMSAPAFATPAAPATPWLVEQQANLLLYLGALLVVVAALVYIAYSHQQLGDWTKLSLLATGTIVFLAAGLTCLRFERVREAGLAFFAVGALMVPLNFAAAVVFLDNQEIDREYLWLAGSGASALFYASVSLLNLGRWYPVPAALSLLSGLLAVLVVSDAPGEVYPIAFAAGAIGLSLPGLLRDGSVKRVFAPAWSFFAYAVTVLTASAALAVATTAPADRWYLTPTLALVAVFFVAQAWAAAQRQRGPSFQSVFALSAGAACVVSLVFSLDLGDQWYGPALLGTGFAYAAAAGIRIARPLTATLVLLAGVLVSAAWLALESVYSGFPQQGAAVHLGAAIFYGLAARLLKGRLDISTLIDGIESQGRRDPTPVCLPLAAPLIYASGLTAALSLYWLARSLAADEALPRDVTAWQFFTLATAFTALGASARAWWPEVRGHIYLVALLTIGSVLVYAAGLEGDVTVMLALATAGGLLIALYERQPWALLVPAAFAYALLLAIWRYYDLRSALLPVAVSLGGVVLFALCLGLRARLAEWRPALLFLAVAFAVLAPVTGWASLLVLADESGFIDGRHFEKTALYLTTAATVVVLGALVGLLGRLLRRIELVIGASALLMLALLLFIRHFDPENLQAYTAPTGVYFVLLGLVATRIRSLPSGWHDFTDPLMAFGAALIMAPSLFQELDNRGSGYGLLLLAEGLAFVLLALTQRWPWLLATAVGFVALDAGQYLLTGPTLPVWAILAIVGVLVMIVGTSLLLGRDRWAVWQRSLLAWWNQEPGRARDAGPG